MTREEGLARIEECRKRIDELDGEITGLLNERARMAAEIGQVKRAFQMAVYAPKREEMVYANIFSHNSGPLRNDALRRVYERIIDEMRNLERQHMEAGQSEDSRRQDGGAS
jgi:chorismate mutase